ncbi:MAG: ABC transporter ATP-binding protein [Myxococcota bacterium]|jgi:ATP-binding cassette subfamily C protein|nr:ABC transporter ATP-binding protein [Myxococcota bacterium]
MRLFLVFARKYPVSTSLMVLGLIAASLAEGIGIMTMLPLFSIYFSSPDGEGPPLPTGDLEIRVTAFIEQLGIDATAGVLAPIVVGFIYLKAGLLIAAKRQVGYTVARASMDLRLRLLDAMMGARWRYFVGQRMGTVTNAISSESERASNAFLYASTVLSLLINNVIYIAITIVISWEATVAVFATALTGMLLLSRLVRATRKAGVKQTKLMRSLINRLSDALQAIKPLKAMARQNRIAPLLSKDTRKLNRAARKKVLATEALSAIQEPIILTCLVLVAWFAASVLAMPGPRFLVFGAVFIRLLTQLARAQRQYQKFTTQESAYWAIEDTIQRALDHREEVRPGIAPSLKHQIECIDICLKYEDKMLFDHANLTLPAGRITALVGPSGSGKTTLGDLVIGLIEPDSGSIELDGVPLAEVDTVAWRERIGYVPQEMFLLNDTIRVNVTLGEEGLDDAAAERALRRAGAWGFVSMLPDGLGSTVGERGAFLSGGQRQRIAIARALVHEPMLLVLDEATTALDPEAEASVWRSLRELRDEVTILAVSHQNILADAADRIYRVEGGKVVVVDADTVGQGH